MLRTHPRPSWLVTLAALASACAEPTPFSDAGPAPDASPAVDATAEPAAAIRVLEGGAPVAGIQVLFHDASAALIDRQITDADGRAEIPAGAASATMVDGPTGADRLTTIDLEGVDGDVEVGTPATPDLTPGPPVALSIATPAPVAHVFARAPCAEASGATAGAQIALTLSPPAACAQGLGDSYPILLESDREAGLYAIVPVATSAGQVEVPASAWLPMPTIAHVLDAPATVFRVELTRRGLVGDVAVTSRGASLTGQAPFTIELPFPHVPAGDVRLAISTGPKIRAAVVRRPASANQPIDLDALLLPAPDSPVADLAAGTVGWTSPTPIDADLVRLDVEYLRDRGTTSRRWIFVGPVTRTTWTLPQLPDDLVDLGLRPSDDIDEGDTTVIDVVEHDGYGDLVRRLVDLERLLVGDDTTQVRVSRGV